MYFIYIQATTKFIQLKHLTHPQSEEKLKPTGPDQPRSASRVIFRAAPKGAINIIPFSERSGPQPGGRLGKFPWLQSGWPRETE